jgi:light-regulated signal transduction histidine kinase (bacteriophytochrome)
MSANSELEKFSYTLSHDMRNYLARILMALHGLTTECAADLNETGRYFVTSIEDSCQELEELVDAILRLCSSNDAEVPRLEVDLSAVALEVAQELNSQYSRKKVDFTVAPGLVAFGDNMLLKAVLKNLLGNAWKYSQNSPHAKVSFCSEEHDGEVVYVVSDNGVGFDMIEADRLFKPFCRLSNSDGVKGMGIGLATVRRIIRSHGGEIWGKGERGMGATFYFTLQPSA